MSRSRLTWMIASGTALLIGAGILAPRFFFTEVRFIESIGEVSETYRWGRLTWVSVDSNRDGKEDARARFEPEFGNVPVEMWEDRDGDDVFEIYLNNSDGEGAYLDRDLDGDGVRETRITGDAIDRFFLENPAPGVR